MPSPRVLVLGLDCVPPELLFDRFRADLPNLSRIVDGGIHGPLESCIPPITCPAWMCMMTGRDPGRLGIYGLRNRRDRSYDAMAYATSRMVSEPTAWDHLSRAGKQVILLGVPGTYPPKPVNGVSVGCFFTPDATCDYTYPSSVKGEIERVVGRYEFDVKDFRTEEKDRVLKQIHEMTEKRFRLARYFLTEKPWDFFMMVEMGTDRIHHGFWKYHDPEHRKHPTSSPYENAIRDYYRYLDREVGELLRIAGDDTAVMLVSDHGAKRIEGGIGLNEWLIRQGLLVLHEDPQTPVPLEKARVDWSRTVAWGSGGYYGRVFLNVKGREPNGVIDPKDVDRVRDQVARGLEAIPDERGEPLKSRAYRPEEIYGGEVRGIAPDLIVYFGDLYWRAVGTVRMDSIHTFENDTGPDDANHAQHGVFALSAPGMRSRGRVDGLRIYDVAPTVMSLFGLPAPDGMGGTARF